MAQRDLKQTIESKANSGKRTAPVARVPLTEEERERLDKAVAHIVDLQSRQIARSILEDYRETFDYLKDK
jgi:hypothetical protein